MEPIYGQNEVSVYHLRYTKPDGKPSTISTGCEEQD
jgi:hypothetical protein